MLISQFKTSLANYLDDPDNVYWGSSELDNIIKEAILTFGAISGYWKRQVELDVTTKHFYDILNSEDIDSGSEQVISSLTYQTILDWIDSDLVDYSQTHTTEDILSLITKAINDFQSETKLVLSRSRYPLIVNQPVSIGDEVLDITKAYLIDSENFYHALKLADENRVALLNNNYTTTQGRPKFYSINNLSLKSIDLFPKVNEDGFLELVYVKGITGEVTEETSCLIPDNLVPYIKYRVLYYLFNSEAIQDPSRAAYCLGRWNEGLLVGKNYATIINVKLDGVNKVLASLEDFDNNRYDWYNLHETVVQKVNAIASAGLNILALNRAPTQEHSILLEVIANAPIAEANLDIRPDYIPHLFSYCIHLANIKNGIGRIQKTTPEFEKFIEVATKHNIYLATRRISYIDLIQKSKYPLRQAKIERQENAA